MSLADRLQTDLHEIAARIEPSAEAALNSVLARRARFRHMVRQVVSVAAGLVLVGTLLVVWRLVAASTSPDVAIEEAPLDGTYEATLSGVLEGDWRLRLDDDTLTILAPDAGPLGVRIASAPYAVDRGVLTTDLLDDGPCSRPGAYTWTSSTDGLSFTVEKDDCPVRVQLLTSSAWSTVSGVPLSEGTYQTPELTPQQLRDTAMAAGFSVADVDDYLGTGLADARSVSYTLQVAGDAWTVFETRDGGVPSVVWSGPYAVVDAGTAVAGEPPCGPIVYDYRLQNDRLSFVMLEDECRVGGAETAPTGELIAQTIIYETEVFTRVAE